MADQRGGGIAWTDRTWNPTRGCSRVDGGCVHCYAEGVARRFSGPGLPYEGLVRLDADGKAKAQWSGVVKLIPEHLGDPLRWREPRRIFVNSMSDLFHEALPFEAIAAVFGVMAAASQHTFQVLTKRPERAAAFFAWLREEAADLAGAVGELPPSGSAMPSACAMFVGRDLSPPMLAEDALGAVGWRAAMRAPWPLPNVQILVSVHDQASADLRIPVLLTLPAAVRGVSYEPAIGPVDLRLEWLAPFVDVTPSLERTPRLDWVIVGGESGPGARPFDLAWARSVVRQCRAAHTPCFVKQLGAYAVSSDVVDDVILRHGAMPRDRRWVRTNHRSGADSAEWPEDLRVRELPGVSR